MITNFIHKVRAGANEKSKKLIGRELNVARATVLDGSFGTEKEHYSLRKIKA